MTPTRTEPVRTATTLGGAIVAVAAAVLSQTSIDPELAVAVLGLVGALVPIVLGEWSRSRVTPFDLAASIEVVLRLAGPTPVAELAEQLGVSADDVLVAGRTLAEAQRARLEVDDAPTAQVVLSPVG